MMLEGTMRNAEVAAVRASVARSQKSRGVRADDLIRCSGVQTLAVFGLALRQPLRDDGQCTLRDKHSSASSSTLHKGLLCCTPLFVTHTRCLYLPL